MKLIILLITIITFSINSAYSDSSYPLLNKALFCKDDSVNWRFRPLIIYFGENKKELVDVSVYYDWENKRVINGTYRTQISFYKVTDELIGWRYLSRGLKLNYFNSSGIDTAMYLDRTTLKLSKQWINPPTSNKPHYKFQCKILNSLKEADEILNKSIKEGYEEIYRIVGKPLSKEELKKKKEEKLKDRKI
ncbi:hypothetical protein OAS37_07415 [Alphaproteobacteria bacterium]|nr:hypothetical protein [Alphaproteobacteria bacterium]